MQEERIAKSDTERQEKAAEGHRVEARDHALVRLDEKEVKERMLSAFEQLIGLGFETHLVAVKERQAVIYSIMLQEDGGDNIPLRELQTVCDELRLDMFFARGKGIVMYARW